MDAKARLLEAYQAHGASLPEYGWPSETDRWMELLVCVLHQVRREGPITEVREALLLWRELGLISPAALASLAQEEEYEIALRIALRRRGFSAEEAQEGVAVARELAAAVLARYDGKIQLFLRRHAEAALEELADALGGAGVPADTLRFALTHWLQNATNAPLSLGHESVEAFCRKHELSAEQVRAAADDLDLNLALLDDLLEAAARDEGD